MASAPERISVKRRRVDEPINHLVYQSKKQRTTDHIFVRLVAEESTKPVVTTQQPPLHAASKPGIPTPGDEVRDFQRYRAAQALRDNPYLAKDSTQSLSSAENGTSPRRFHLTRDLSMSFRPVAANGIRKSKHTLRPHLPTFIERPKINKDDSDIELKSPVDRVVRPAGRASKDVLPEEILSNSVNVEKSDIPTFHKPKANVVKTGCSIRDDPATWDLESHQLANELMALALDMDPEAKAAYFADPENARTESDSDRMVVDDPNDYIYETYVRMQQDTVRTWNLSTQSDSFGYLYIDDEDEDLWDQYLRDEDDEDDDWNEEDEDSNAEDNPRNEYPDEEISSDDEFGTNNYKYRRYGSDNEQYDEDA
ncbi:hypothetical protein LTR64_004136 [Lithohypha guttulata]|uniref:uncharacterized protein n=1 Tax=Lithohypha guttulata TaxID=1690604 RepID=UPI00315D75D6